MWDNDSVLRIVETVRSIRSHQETIMAAPSNNPARASRLGLLHCAVTGALVFGVILVACWLGAVLTPMPVTHMYISMFSAAEITSSAALFAGLCWSLIFGAWAGLVLALVNNFVARFNFG
jgi:hypothetical protein